MDAVILMEVSECVECLSEEAVGLVLVEDFMLELMVEEVAVLSVLHNHVYFILLDYCVP